jgi:hypothetical protein
MSGQAPVDECQDKGMTFPLITAVVGALVVDLSPIYWWITNHSNNIFHRIRGLGKCRGSIHRDIPIDYDAGQAL